MRLFYDGPLGAQLGLGLDLAVTAPLPGQTAMAPRPSIDMAQLVKTMAQASQSAAPEVERRDIGRMALGATTMSEEQSIRRVGFLSNREWPANLWATAVNAQTGKSVVWHKGSTVPLELGVASSCALPGVWPPVTISGERYMDGGVRSMLNSDLATGYAAVIVVSCFALVQPVGLRDAGQAALNASLEAEIARLREHGASVTVITPSTEFLDLTQHGAKMLDVSLALQAWQTGARQAIQEATRIGASWREA